MAHNVRQILCTSCVPNPCGELELHSSDDRKTKGRRTARVIHIERIERTFISNFLTGTTMLGLFPFPSDTPPPNQDRYVNIIRVLVGLTQHCCSDLCLLFCQMTWRKLFRDAVLSCLVRWRLPKVHADSSLQVRYHLTQSCMQVCTYVVLSCLSLLVLYCKGFQEEFCNRGIHEADWQSSVKGRVETIFRW